MIAILKNGNFFKIISPFAFTSLAAYDFQIVAPKTFWNNDDFPVFINTKYLNVTGNNSLTKKSVTPGHCFKFLLFDSPYNSRGTKTTYFDDRKDLYSSNRRPKFTKGISKGNDIGYSNTVFFEGFQFSGKCNTLPQNKKNVITI
jgi:hypothetical protein